MWIAGFLYLRIDVETSSYYYFNERTLHDRSLHFFYFIIYSFNNSLIQLLLLPNPELEEMVGKKYSIPEPAAFRNLLLNSPVVLKTAERKLRGFESYPLRHIFQ